MGGGNFSGPRGGPGYNAQEQLAFEQQKYEQQQQVRRVIDPRNYGGYQQGTTGNWDNGYEEQPNIPTGPQAGMGRGQPAGRGPRNAGKPGANYRGGGRGVHRGFHPYARG
ncbi:hypothetical protein CISG_03294 [Coccidioides immitis RMSCC 3703]|uniref:Uncharacterized protein n=1 Tax=Coccidioides immitis RMSCC 3703 TaxID=454286 RepID=A0A0J8QK93_COCIT|nr:hypothetical protein CISG_03294 [Coccidioides immitis RMSCC 3703]